MKLSKVSRSLNNKRLFPSCCRMTQGVWAVCYLVSGLTTVVKLFCCLFAVMDKVLGLFFVPPCPPPFLFFGSHSGHISLLDGRRSGCFCGITSLAVSQHGGPVCPASLCTAMHTLKKKKAWHGLLQLCHCRLDCAFPPQTHCRMFLSQTEVFSCKDLELPLPLYSALHSRLIRSLAFLQL